MAAFFCAFSRPLALIFRTFQVKHPMRIFVCVRRGPTVGDMIVYFVRRVAGMEVLVWVIRVIISFRGK